jgi:hypothetical protein
MPSVGEKSQFFPKSRDKTTFHKQHSRWTGCSQRQQIGILGHSPKDLRAFAIDAAINGRSSHERLAVRQTDAICDLAPCRVQRLSRTADNVISSKGTLACAIRPIRPPAGRRSATRHRRRRCRLRDGKLVLTFDDGPWPGTTRMILDALGHECVKATFFMLRHNVEAHPELARAVCEAEHVVGGHHTYSHRLLDRLPTATAEAEIDRGIAAVEQALYGGAAAKPVTPFFRFPGFASRPDLLDRGRTQDFGVRHRSVGERLDPHVLRRRA